MAPPGEALGGPLRSGHRDYVRIYGEPHMLTDHLSAITVDWRFMFVWLTR